MLRFNLFFRSGKLENSTKEVFSSCFWWAFFIGVITMLIRPFISIRQTIRDTAITFLVSMLSGLLAEYLNIPEAVKYGLSGVCGLFAVRLYIIGENLLCQTARNPVGCFKRILGKKDD